MEEIELTSAVQILILRNKGYRFKHIKTGNIYTLITHIRSKNPLNEDWYDAFLYTNDKNGCNTLHVILKETTDNEYDEEKVVVELNQFMNTWNPYVKPEKEEEEGHEIAE